MNKNSGKIQFDFTIKDEISFQMAVLGLKATSNLLEANKEVYNDEQKAKVVQAVTEFSTRVSNICNMAEFEKPYKGS